MRIALVLSLSVLTLAACKPAPASQDAPSQKDMQGMAMPSSAGVQSGSGTGVVKAVDLKAHTITIDHGPIEAIGWPAMTMTFPVLSPDLLDGIAAGQTVSFDVTVTDNKPLITALKP